MLKTQLNCWEQVQEMLQDTYKVSLEANEQFRETCVNMLKESMETSVKSVRDVQEGMRNIATLNLNTTMDAMGRFSDLFLESNKKGLDTLRSLFEKYRIDNKEYIQEIERFWQENSTDFQRKFRDFTSSFMKEQEKNIDMHMKTYNECAKEILEKINTGAEDAKAVRVEEAKKKK